MSKLSSKNQITIPVEVLRESGLVPGEHLVVRASGRGRVEIERAEALIERYQGSLAGIWPPGELDALRDEWER